MYAVCPRRNGLPFHLPTHLFDFMLNPDQFTPSTRINELIEGEMLYDSMHPYSSRSVYANANAPSITSLCTIITYTPSPFQGKLFMMKAAYTSSDPSYSS
jgi:hypothetical protein